MLYSGVTQKPLLLCLSEIQENELPIEIVVVVLHILFFGWECHASSNVISWEKDGKIPELNEKVSNSFACRLESAFVMV